MTANKVAVQEERLSEETPPSVHDLIERSHVLEAALSTLLDDIGTLIEELKNDKRRTHV